MDTKELSLEEIPYDVPNRLTTSEAIWYYNNLADRRGEVYFKHFVHLTQMGEWLEVYNSAKEDTPSRFLAFEKISNLSLEPAQWVQLHEISNADATLTNLCKKRLEEYAGNDFDRWREVLDISPDGSTIRAAAVTKMRERAKNYGQWRDIYDRSELTSKQQIEALSNMLLLFRGELTPRTTDAKRDADNTNKAVKRSPAEWREIALECDIYDPERDAAAINIYISADLNYPAIDEEPQEIESKTKAA
ncbi:MAG: hypothetical protein LBU73_04495 [Helicobacteraceae bacterium]|jgi:hypothetical protein|nr:hypothetical protein [Helicobacteraceae bacterium]